jgi:hypothetical protein
MTYKGYCYWISGTDGNYTGYIEFNNRVLSVSGSKSIVKTAQLIRKRIDLLT